MSVATAGASDDGVRAFAEGYLLAAYRPERWSGAPDERPRPAEQLVLLDPASDAEPVLVRARRAARATWLVRDLTATPSSTKDPAWLAERARDLATSAGLDVRVLGPRELAAQGFGGILAVGGGSSRPPRLVVVSHEPEPGDGATGRHVVVVGKGVTYDTGGLSLKPRTAMVPMKTDMAGAAVALAVVLAAAEAGSPHRVTAVLPLAENHLGAASYRPGDVLRLHGGTTVEVANTDAEGRLILADALDLAVRELTPDVLVDVATLTGAAAVGLGERHAALYATDDALARTLEQAAARTGSGCGGCRSSPTTPTRSAPRSRTCATSRPSRPATRGRSPPRCSCASSPARCRGPTSTSRGPLAPRRAGTRSSRARRASARASCSTRSTCCPERSGDRSAAHAQQQPVAGRHERGDEALVVPDGAAHVP
ncbi:hypothetical protein GCM10025864_01360 [Luteimicrobium album]|uniref:Probable cytosol aminopeptidase n=1 Tax=Luteimicrobium album TaxID=1054550 RepID=A0ABQ6HVF1_9MICO|nr:hypothetical protein GCM10025864_01360 [Luteimicrobium album]